MELVNAIIPVDLETGKRLYTIPGLNKQTALVQKGHRLPVYALTASDDDGLLVSGSAENAMHVWDAKTMQHVKTFTAHRGGITVGCVVFD